jgi:6-phosphogluconate dehydrogenase
MQLGMIGLGRMGANMTRRLLRGGHQVVAYDLDLERVKELGGEGATAANSVEELARALAPPRAVWLMVPAGEPTERMIETVASQLGAGDTVIDGGNTFFKDDVRRAEVLKRRSIHYVDVGTSGGVWGLERGYSLMIGGPREVVARLDPIFSALAPGLDESPQTPGRERRTSTAERGYLHCGKAGAGHFVKMVHNGIEYGLMQAYAEGFDLLATAGAASVPEHFRYDLPLDDIAEVWRHGSVIGSWLLDLTAGALAEDPRLSAFSGYVQDSGEGRWTVETALERAVPVHVLAASLFARFRSRSDRTFADRVLSAMRYKFGGHVEKVEGR